MNRKISSLLLLLVLTITDAYLLAHPNLIGRIGIFVYKHTYIRNFPRALLTVALTVGIALSLSELAYRFMKKKPALITFLFLDAVALAWFMYVYVTFSSFSYRLTGKAFIYGAHLMPVILIGIFSRYLFKRILAAEVNSKGISAAGSSENSGVKPPDGPI
ncbi:hypothetical protein [Dyadobacter sp. CY343]|uniref:hypothetical protein n=1 Tax=Dyadobacter sp. CY343 TaxID=2907299 RepID=UPI001F400C1A|nr:hypothetical protein [Dyadobacter sp. CY343]MCE7060268.1 hypothetical protein [Dyadobacter sp. CY343]